MQESCKWYVKASRYKGSKLWMLRKYVFARSMNTTQTSHRQTSSSLIDDCLKDEFRFNSTDQSIPRDIVHKVHTQLGVNVSYRKSLKDKEYIVKSLKVIIIGLDSKVICKVEKNESMLIYFIFS